MFICSHVSGLNGLNDKFGSTQFFIIIFLGSVIVLFFYVNIAYSDYSIHQNSCVNLSLIGMNFMRYFTFFKYYTDSTVYIVNISLTSFDTCYNNCELHIRGKGGNPKYNELETFITGTDPVSLGMQQTQT